MANYLYNGVELPDINEVWTDKETYPCAAICAFEIPEADLPGGGLYAELIFSTAPMASFNGVLMQPEGVGTFLGYALTSNLDAVSGWGTEITESDLNKWIYGLAMTNPGESEPIGQSMVASLLPIVWSNADIVAHTDLKGTTDGAIYLAASDPVPVGGSVPAPSIDPTAMLLGWLIGKRIAGQRGNEQKEPVAYLYNGVRLPALPEWDKEAYPYAYITEASVSTTEKTFLWLFSNQKTVNSDGKISYGGTGARPIRFESVDGNWEEIIVGAGIYPLIWCNVDTYHGSTLYLPASDPVPVYE